MDIDRRLHEAGQRWRESQGPALQPPSAASLRETARPRQWRKGLAPMAAAAAVAVIILAIVSVQGATTDAQQLPAGSVTTPAPSVSSPSAEDSASAARAAAAATAAAKTARVEAEKARRLLGTVTNPSQTEEPRETGLTSSHRLRRDGIGGVKLEMTLAETQTAAGQRFVQELDVMNNCVYMVPKTRVPAVWFMFVDGVMSRVDVKPGGKTRTSEGIGNGSTEQQVKDAYPGIVLMTPEFFDPTSGLYDPPSYGPYHPAWGRILNLRPDDSGRSMIFETDGVKVTSFRGGLETAVTRSHGCA